MTPFDIHKLLIYTQVKKCSITSFMNYKQAVKRVFLRSFFLLLTGFFFLLPLSLVSADERRAGENLTIKIALIGPGTELYFWWGHIGLLIEDHARGTSTFYDYGIFSFDNENFFTNFAMGRLIYSSGASEAERNYYIYRVTNRDIILYTLDLAPEIRERVRLFAEENVLPENRDYFYHHFKDNCSTRIRDIIDFALEGQFKEAFGTAPGRFTFREHIRRHMWFAPVEDWYLNFLMGRDIDKPITIWEEMFLPSEVAKRITDFTYIDPQGVERTLVSNVETLNQSINRPAVLDAPPETWHHSLFLGLIISAILMLFTLLKKKTSVPLGISHSLLGIFWGLSGTLLFFMSFFTDHDYTYNNINVVFVNPLLLAAIPLGFMSVSKNIKKRLFAEKLLKFLWTYVFFSCIIAMVINRFPGFLQQNQATEALVIPFSLLLSSVLLLAFRMVSKKKNRKRFH